jgi:hypothetical protein
MQGGPKIFLSCEDELSVSLSQVSYKDAPVDGERFVLVGQPAAYLVNDPRGVGPDRGSAPHIRCHATLASASLNVASPPTGL